MACGLFQAYTKFLILVFGYSMISLYYGIFHSLFPYSVSITFFLLGRRGMLFLLEINGNEINRAFFHNFEISEGESRPLVGIFIDFPSCFFGVGLVCVYYFYRLQQGFSFGLLKYWVAGLRSVYVYAR